MEPLSLVASIVGVTTAVASITSVVTEFARKVKDAPASAHRVLDELLSLDLCLLQLKPFVEGTRRADNVRQDFVSVEQVVVPCTALVLSTSELEKLLASLHIDQPTPKICRLQWVMHEAKINRILSRIQMSKSSLNLLLTIFTWCVKLDFNFR